MCGQQGGLPNRFREISKIVLKTKLFNLFFWRKACFSYFCASKISPPGRPLRWGEPGGGLRRKINLIKYRYG